MGCGTETPAPSSPIGGRVVTVEPARASTEEELLAAAGMLETRLAAFGITADVAVSDGRVTIELPPDSAGVPAPILDVGRVSIARVPPGAPPPPDGAEADLADFVGPADFDPETSEPAVDPGTGSTTLIMGLRPEAARRFQAFSAANVGRSMAILIDGRVLTAPTIQAEIPDGRIQVAPGLDSPLGPNAVAALVGYLRTGPLPVAFVDAGG